MSIFPFINPEAIQAAEEQEPLPLFCEYAYDFEKNCLKLKDGKTYLIYENEALRVWIFKALATPRFRFIAYSAGFGNETETLVGSSLHSDVVASELRRFVIEALMVNPYIKELSGFAVTKEGNLLAIQFDCTTVYGTMTGLQLKGGDSSWILAFKAS